MLDRKLGAECVGTALLLATVVGSGIMGESLAGGNVAVALLANTIATGAILYVLITMLGPLSGAHFNPAVTFVFMLKKDLPLGMAAAYILAQVLGGILGTWSAHLMFDEPLLQLSEKMRTGPSQWFSESVATFGLVFVILATLRARADAVAAAVGLYITAAYWFTASTSFANPAVTIARSLTDTFSGIRPLDMPLFIAAQIVGAFVAFLLCRWLLATEKEIQIARGTSDAKGSAHEFV